MCELIQIILLHTSQTLLGGVSCPVAEMLSNTVLLLWCLVVSVCWMTETEAWISNSDGKIKRGKQSTMKVHYFLSICHFIGFRLHVLVFPRDLSNSFLISKSLIIKKKISSIFHLLEQYSYFLLARISLSCFFQDLIHYQRNIRNLCSSMKDVCKREADMSSFEKD